jgi:hypothetical protein
LVPSSFTDICNIYFLSDVCILIVSSCNSSEGYINGMFIAFSLLSVPNEKFGGMKLGNAASSFLC